MTMFYSSEIFGVEGSARRSRFIKHKTHNKEKGISYFGLTRITTDCRANGLTRSVASAHDEGNVQLLTFQSFVSFLFR